ncbi:hypothetical protein GUJ93_ZPchr0010g8758 [Zizania palustris]|uniref:Uncharacterized protein n=1 Tax=Zizania palustris TaxID=103762 RepID=A0A8J5W806_ZIZPA|nr:hypothetical protein GUJ93_ZPchr0010g8758 [Zizania palustris]
MPGDNLAEEDEQLNLIHFGHDDLPEPMVPEAEADADSVAASGISSESSMEVVLAMPPIPPSPPPPPPAEDAGLINLILPIHLPAGQAAHPDVASIMPPPQRDRPPIKLVYSRRPKALVATVPAPVISLAQLAFDTMGSARKNKTPLSDKELRRSLRLKIKSLGFKKNPSSAKAGPSLQAFPAIEDFINISSDSDDPESVPADGVAPGATLPPRLSQATQAIKLE